MRPPAPEMVRNCAAAPGSGSGRGWLLIGLWCAVTAGGCGHEAKISFADAEKPPTFQVINPPLRDIVRVVGQPSFIESYERTSIYPKPTAYIKKWVVDIGDKVKKNDVLATLFAPELDEELTTKKATVVLDIERIRLAKEQVEVAKADVSAAVAAPERGRGDSEQVRVGSRALGHRGQAAGAASCFSGD